MMPDFLSWLLIFPILIVIVCVHEFGHFITAKFFGMRVEEFGVGFPPRIFGKRLGGTIYSINLIPLGGFVKLSDPKDPEDYTSFENRHFLERLLVLIAGSVMNLFFAILIFTIIFMLPHARMIGGDIVVNGLVPNSPADIAGIRVADQIVALNENRFDSFKTSEVRLRKLVDWIDQYRGQEVEVVVKRGSISRLGGISPELITSDVVNVVPRKIDPSPQVVVDEVKNPETEISLIDASKYLPNIKIGDTVQQRALGVSLGLVNVRTDQVTRPLHLALADAGDAIWNSVIVASVQGLFSNTNSSQSGSGLMGPIGIAQVTGEVINKFGLGEIIVLIAVLSVSLGIINLLPIPFLDGGRVAVLVIEVLRGGKLSKKIESLIHASGFVLLLIFILVISYSDILRLIRGDSIFR